MPEDKKPEPLLINNAAPVGSGRFFYKIDTNKGVYYYTPTEFVTNGLLQGDWQFFDQGFLRHPDAFKNAMSVNIEKGFLSNMESAGYNNPNSGILMTRDQAKYLLGSGKSEFGDWDNDVSSGGWVDSYNINAINKNTGSAYGAIQGLGNLDGQYVYARPTEGGWESSYIIPYDQFDNGFSMRNTRVEYKGIFGSKVAKTLAGIAGEIGKIPFLTELTAAIPVVGPAVYGTLKGVQAGMSGKGPLEAAAQVGASLALASGIQSLLPGTEGAFGGDVEAQPGGFYGTGSSLPGTEGFAAAATEVGGGGAGTPNEVFAGPGTEVVPTGPTAPVEVAPIPPEAVLPELPAPAAAEVPVEALSKPPETPSPIYKFDDGSELQIFGDGSTVATDPAGNFTSSPASDLVQAAYTDPNAPGFGGDFQAPIESREDQIGPYQRETGKSTLEDIFDLTKTAGETAYDLATDYPLTTLSLASAAANIGEKPQTAQAPEAPAKKTYSYRSPIEYKPSEGLKELWRASEGIYGKQPPLQLPRPPEAQPSAQAQNVPLLGGQAPGGLAALRPTYTPLSGGPTIDIGNMSIDQIIQLQNALEGRRLGYPA